MLALLGWLLLPLAAVAAPAAPGPDACQATGDALTFLRTPQRLLDCRVSDDPVQQAWVARASTKLGQHERAASAWLKVGAAKALEGVARGERLRALLALGKVDEVVAAVGRYPMQYPELLYDLLEQATRAKSGTALVKEAGEFPRKADTPRQLAIGRATCLKTGDAACVRWTELHLQRKFPGTPEERAIAAAGVPLGLDAKELGWRWQRAQALGSGALAGEECATWVASLPAETTPAIDDAIATCGRLTSLLRLPSALDILTRATSKPATANAAWLGIARIHARSNDLDAIDQACGHVAAKSVEEAECLTLTAVLRLRANHLDVAWSRLAQLDERFPKSPKRREAWLQFVVQRWDDPEVPKILKSLLDSATDPVSRAEAAYWLGRRSTDPVTARKYWEISRTADPLGYFGTLANARLEGPTGTATTPVRTTPADKTLALLRRAGFYEEAERRVRKSRSTQQVVNQMALIGEGGAWETIVRAGILGGGETKWPVSPLNRAAFPLAFPDELAAVPDARRPLLLSLMRRESLFDPGAISFVGARGLLQLMPKTAARVSTDAALPVPTTEDLHLPALNVDLADRYLALLLERFGHPLVAAAAYNAGPPAVLKWIAETKTRDLDLFVERIPYRETRLYVRAVGAALAGYTRLETGQFPAISSQVPTPKPTGVDY